MSGVGISGALFFFLGIAAVALFSFIAIASWSDSRRREREAYYRSETLKKVAESQAGGAVLELFREEQKSADRKRREGLKLGGLINLAVGAGLMIFLGGLIPHERVYLVGIIPLLIGAALLGYALLLAPRE